MEGSENNPSLLGRTLPLGERTGGFSGEQMGVVLARNGRKDLNNTRCVQGFGHPHSSNFYLTNSAFRSKHRKASEIAGLTTIVRFDQQVASV